MEHYVGPVVAEQGEEREEYLERAFVMTESIRRALEPGRPFVCGRRGAGKTAVALRLKFLREDADGIEFDTYRYIGREEYSILQRQGTSGLAHLGFTGSAYGSDIVDCYYYVWTYILELEAMRCASALDSDEPSSQDQRIVSAYLDQIGCHDRSPVARGTSVFNECMEEVGRKSGSIMRLALDLRELILDPDYVAARSAAQGILSRRSAVIAIDSDEHYDTQDSKILPTRGLCRAVKDIESSGKFRQLTVKCFLPAELTELLFSEHIAKFNALTVYLLWNSSELFELLHARYMLDLTGEIGVRSSEIEKGIIEEVAKGPRSGESRLSFWRRAFWEHIAPPVVHNTYDRPELSAVFLLRHTQKRPREVLSCMNFVLEAAAREGELPAISAESVVNGIHHVDNIYQLLSDNLSIFDMPVYSPTPNLAELAQHILKDTRVTFSGKDFRDFAKRAHTLLQLPGGTSDSETMSLLLRSGLVGTVEGKLREFTLPGEASSTKYYLTQFEYTIPGRVIVGDASSCAVHPILGDRLSLRDLDDVSVMHLPEKQELPD